MLRRCTSLLLIFAYLASQLVVAPHSHADTSRNGHPSLPHVHLSLLGSADHAHGHSHGHTHDATDRTLPDEPAILPSTLAEHDADAVYLCDAAPSVPAKSASGAEQAGVRLAIASVAVACVLVQARAEARCPAGEYFLGKCARYLELRTLRI
jgi:hypothetical protein